MPDVWNVAESLEVEYRQPIRQSSDQSNSGRKEIEKQPCGKEIEGRESRSRRDHIGQDLLASSASLSKVDLYKLVNKKLQWTTILTRIDYSAVVMFVFVFIS